MKLNIEITIDNNPSGYARGLVTINFNNKEVKWTEVSSVLKSDIVEDVRKEITILADKFLSEELADYIQKGEENNWS